MKNKKFIKSPGKVVLRIGEPILGRDPKVITNDAYNWVKNNYKEIIKTNLNGVGKIRVIKNRTYLLSSVKLEKANYIEKLKYKSDWFSFWASLTFKN